VCIVGGAKWRNPSGTSIYIADKILMFWNREIEQVKLLWNQFRPDEATWDMVDHMQVMYPSLFAS